MRTAAVHRWRTRPVATMGVRAVAYLVPIGASIGTGVLVSRLLPSPVGLAGHVGWLLFVMASTAVAFLVVERAARRLLPLSMLLRLSLVFPDRAPSRFAIALRAGNTRRLQAWAHRQAASDVPPDAGRQAQTALTLIVALGAHDRRSRGHSERVQALTNLMAHQLRLSEGATDRLRWAALLHDIGKLSVPARVLNHPGRPSSSGMRALRRHPTERARIAGPLASWLGDWGCAIAQHHERFDGTGYPVGLRGEDISMAGRIVAVTDAFETMTAVRSYKKAMSIKDARAELVRCAGGHFDPRLVRSFLEISVGKLRRSAGLAAAVAGLPLVGILPRAATVAAGGLVLAGGPGLTGAALLGLGALLNRTVPVAARSAPTAAPRPAVVTAAGAPTNLPGSVAATPPAPAAPPRTVAPIPPVTVPSAPVVPVAAVVTSVEAVVSSQLPALGPLPSSVSADLSPLSENLTP